jgi:hypothetical protein
MPNQRNTGQIRRAFNLMKKRGKLQIVPNFPMSPESKARKGFVDKEQFTTLREKMPENLRPLLTFLYTTGCRFGAATSIELELGGLAECHD